MFTVFIGSLFVTAALSLTYVIVAAFRPFLINECIQNPSSKTAIAVWTAGLVQFCNGFVALIAGLSSCTFLGFLGYSLLIIGPVMVVGWVLNYFFAPSMEEAIDMAMKNVPVAGVVVD